MTFVYLGYSSIVARTYIRPTRKDASFENHKASCVLHCSGASVLEKVLVGWCLFAKLQTSFSLLQELLSPYSTPRPSKQSFSKLFISPHSKAPVVLTLPNVATL